jgi:hypothetical protein
VTRIKNKVKNKSQIGIILVLIVVLIIGISIFLFLNSAVKEKKIEKNTAKVIDSGLDMKQIETFMESCVEKIIGDKLGEIYSIEHSFGKYTNITGLLAAQLLDEIKSDKFNDCKDFSTFENIGYTFEIPNSINAEIDVNLYDIVIKVDDYKVIAKYKKSSGVINGLQVRVREGLGLTINGSQKIMNDAYDNMLNLNTEDDCKAYKKGNIFNISIEKTGVNNGVLVNVTHIKSEKSLVFNFYLTSAPTFNDAKC